MVPSPTLGREASQPLETTSMADDHERKIFRKEEACLAKAHALAQMVADRCDRKGRGATKALLRYPTTPSLACIPGSTR